MPTSGNYKELTVLWLFAEYEPYVWYASLCTFMLMVRFLNDKFYDYVQYILQIYLRDNLLYLIFVIE